MSDVPLDNSFVGLSQDEAARRLSEFGLNEIQSEKARPAWHLLAEQFKRVLLHQRGNQKLSYDQFSSSIY